MADWQRTIRLPEWKQAKEDQLTIQGLARIIAARLRELEPFGVAVYLSVMSVDDERDELADRFDALASDPSDDPADELNSIMSDLYDWGDQALDDKWNGRKVCWIDTHCTEEITT